MCLNWPYREYKAASKTERSNKLKPTIKNAEENMECMRCTENTEAEWCVASGLYRDMSNRWSLKPQSQEGWKWESEGKSRTTRDGQRRVQQQRQDVYGIKCRFVDR